MNIQPPTHSTPIRPAHNDSATVPPSVSSSSQPPPRATSPTVVRGANSTVESSLRRQLSSTQGPETTSAANASKEVAPAHAKEVKGFEDVYAKAPAAKAEIDKIADEIAQQFGGSVAKAPIKSRERALEKINNDYGGDPTRIKDLARNTIIVDEKNIKSVTEQLRAKGANVKVVDGTKDPLGYSGVNSVLTTKAGISGEIQVNSPAMIYAKEPETLARTLLGDSLYDEISKQSGEVGGGGHSLYEKWRALPPDSSEASTIAGQSRAYYDKIRSANGN